MSNIREDKGYTYGIGSALVSLEHAGYFFIATEVGIAVTKETLNEIYFEMERLQKEPLGIKELKTVKNYLSGAFLRSNSAGCWYCNCGSRFDQRSNAS